jgi:isoquinoline 1-oxidoreductase beta subunit
VPRERRVLDVAARAAGWDDPLPAGRGRGIAFHPAFGSLACQVAELSVSDRGTLRVHRVVCAVDCGQVVHPDTVRAQIEGAIVFGLTAAINGGITLRKGAVEQSSFHDCRLLALAECPDIEVHIVESGEAPGGAGEVGTSPIAPAIANALFAATGQRLRKLPLEVG